MIVKTILRLFALALVLAGLTYAVRTWTARENPPGEPRVEAPEIQPDECSV